MIGTHIADALALLSVQTERPKLADKTVEYYRAALTMVRKEVFADDYAALKTCLGLALHNLAQATGEPVHLKDAAEAFSAATAIWTITDAPETLGGYSKFPGQSLDHHGPPDRSARIVRQSCGRVPKNRPEPQPHDRFVGVGDDLGEYRRGAEGKGYGRAQARMPETGG
jgi:hypothetical protein